MWRLRSASPWLRPEAGARLGLGLGVGAAAALLILPPESLCIQLHPHLLVPPVK